LKRKEVLKCKKYFAILLIVHIYFIIYESSSA